MQLQLHHYFTAKLRQADEKQRQQDLNRHTQTQKLIKGLPNTRREYQRPPLRRSEFLANPHSLDGFVLWKSANVENMHNWVYKKSDQIFHINQVSKAVLKAIYFFYIIPKTLGLPPFPHCCYFLTHLVRQAYSSDQKKCQII